MARALILCVALIVAAHSACAQGVAISGIEFDPKPVAAIQYEHLVYVHYNCTIDLPEGARIVARPWSQGWLAPECLYAGARYFPQGSGSGSGYFTIHSGEPVIDEVFFGVARGDPVGYPGWPSVLHFCVPVEYHFSPHEISGIEMQPSSPGCIMYGQHVDISFDYISAHTGDVHIFARPFTQGALTPGYSASGSVDYPPGPGTGTQWFTILGAPEVTADQIRFQMKDASTSELLLEFFVPCHYEFKAGGFCNVTHTPTAPAALLHEESVSTEVEYHTTQPGGVRIFPRPYTNGAPTPGYVTSASPIYPIGSGTATGWFRISSGERTIDHVRYRMTNADMTQTICEYFLPVNFHYADNVIRSADLVHPSPAYFMLEQHANMDLPYTTVEPTGARIWPLPYTQGGPSPGGHCSGSPIWPTGSGTATGFVGLNETGVVDQLKLLMTNAAQTQTLMTWFVDAQLYFGDQSSYAAVPPPPELASPTGLFTTLANPLPCGSMVRYALPSDGDVRLRLFDVTGRQAGLLLRERQAAGTHVYRLDPGPLGTGLYFLRLDLVPDEGGRSVHDLRKAVLIR